MSDNNSALPRQACVDTDHFISQPVKVNLHKATCTERKSTLTKNQEKG